MSDFKFIHCADLHLGSRFAGIRSKDPGLAERMAESTFSSFARTIDLAISENADFMIISGDIFDKETITPMTRYRFAETVGKTDIPCFIAWGNHDHTTDWEDSIPLPPNVREFGGGPERIMLDLKNGGNVEIAGISFTSRNTKDDLAMKLDGRKDVFTVGCVHCDVDSTEGGYAPARLSDMLTKNIDYWALGHIHKRAVLHEHPHVVYPGNTQGRNIKESGEKGAYVVTVRSDTVTELRFVSTQELVWKKAEADITGCDFSTFVRKAASLIEKDTVVRLTAVGRGNLDRVLRARPDDAAEAIRDKAEGTLADLEIRSGPEKLPSAGGNDIMSKIAETAGRTSGMSREEIIDAICCTETSRKYLRYYFERLSDSELTDIVENAKIGLLERFSEASE